MRTHRLSIAIAFLGICAGGAFAQEAIMDLMNDAHIKLNDGTDVRLYAKVNDSTTWYYLPTGFRLAQRPDGVPHFLFLKYITEQRESAGGASGAILSAMFQYGLTNEQLNELKAKMNASGMSVRSAQAPVRFGRVKLAKVQNVLPAPITADAPGSFQIISAVLNDKTLTRSIACSGRAPTYPGERMSIAANLGPIGAQLFIAPLEKKMASSDLKCEINYNYYVKSPAVDATLTIDMTKCDFREQTISKTFKKLFHYETVRKYCCGIKYSQEDVRKDDGETYDELYQDVQILQDLGAITCHIDTTVDTELAQKITEGFLQMFMQLISQPMNNDTKSDAAKNDEEAKKPLPDPSHDVDNAHSGATYRTNITKTFKRTYHFTASVPIKKQAKMTADLMDIYDSVKNNPMCIGSVVLNDPFFTQREVKVVLDLDAKDIFDETINYATVNIRKRRATGRDFLDSVTIDSKYLKDNGTVASLTYARGDEQNPDSFEYQIQWSLRGGVIYPASPSWQVGNFQGVTVAPPVRPGTIDFQWDNDAMKAKDIARVVAQINYWQFGKEQTANIQPVGDQNVRSFKFFRDDGHPEYAYRLIYFHKTKGRLAGPWQKDSSGYIYASIPDDVATNPDFEARAKAIVDGVVDKVLEQLGKAIGGAGGGRK